MRIIATTRTTLFLILFLFVSSSSYSKQLRLGVFNIEGFGISETVSVSLTNIIRDYLSTVDKYSVPSQEEMRIISDYLVQQKQINPNCNTDQCNIQIADAIGLELMIIGKLFKKENYFDLRLRYVDIVTPKTLNLITMKSTLDENDLLATILRGINLLLDLPVSEVSLESLPEHILDGRGSLEIDSTPDDAMVVIAGEERGKTPLILEDFPVGDYEVQILKPKFLSWEKNIRLKHEEFLRVKAKLEDDWRKLKVITRPNKADIYLNSDFFGQSPLVIPNINPGKYQIKTDRRGFTTVETTIEISSERSNRIVIILTPGISHQEMWEKEELALIKRAEIQNQEEIRKTQKSRQKQRKILSSLSKTMVRIGDFWIDRFPFPNVVGEFPMSGLKWYEANQKCSDEGKRLCTNEEWDRACHGPFSFASPFSVYYNRPKCKLEFGFLPEEVRIGTYSNCVSDYGVFDMSGNLWEWTSGGEYRTQYSLPPEFVTKSNPTRLWFFTLKGNRCSNRGDYLHRNYVGSYTFRCCKDTQEIIDSLTEKKLSPSSPSGAGMDHLRSE